MGFKRYYRGNDYDEVVYDPCRRRIRCILNAAKDNFLVIIALVVFFVAAIIGTVFWIVLKENVPYRWWCVFVPYIIAVIAFVFYAILYFRYKTDDGVFGKPFFTVSLVLFALLCWLSILYTCIVNNPEVDVYENGLYYSIQEDDTLQVIRNGYNSYQMNELKIPEEVNGRKVTSIGKEAFSSSYSLTSIMIPNCITSIGYDAFIGCHALTIYCESANKPDGWHRDFYVCSYGLHCPVIWNCKINDKDKDGYAYTVVDGIRYKIKDNVATVARQPENITNANLKSSITYKEVSYSVTSIGDYAFSECSKLRSITIPNSVTSIGMRPFAACDKLKSITVDESNKVYSSQDGILYNNKKTELICVPNGIKGSLSIPISVTSIGDSAFSGCSLLTNITIPASVTEIYANTFTACSKLENITVDESNTAYSSQDGILYNKAKTQLIRVPLAKSSIIIFASVISINDDAFSGCAKLENINVDENNTEYASQGGLLYNKSKTQLIEVPKAVQGSVVICGVSSIGERAFYGCSSITSVEIPNSVTSIGNNAFENCSKLVTITIPNSVERIDRYAFKNCSSLTSIVLPDSVTCINAGAFWDCTNLKEVTFGSGVKSIEWMIFAGCKKINTIRYNGTIADWANIIKNNDWNYDNLIKTVICTDGVIDLTKALN